MLDVLFINPGNAFGIYQDLSKHYTCIEPPTWALLLAESCRASNYNVAILDVNAESLTDEESLERIKKANPRLICFVVYGQNVNAGTVGMSGAVRLSSLIKSSGIDTPIAYIGSYVQALPKKSLEDEKSIDIVFTNEGVIALKNLLKLSDLRNHSDLMKVNGIAFRVDILGIIINPPEKVVTDLDKELPGYAWDLLPFKGKPLDLYRAPMWHAEYDESKRSPYAAIQTSLGCPFGCEFCIINIINRDDNEEIGVAGNYSKIRYWSTDFIIKEFDKLAALGVKTIKITDELFLFNKKHYVPLCEKLKERGYGKDFLLWAYSRVDTVAHPENLKLVREAGIRWLALGIESGSRSVRLEVSKGKFQDINIKQVVDQIHNAGIEVMANFIFGLPGDTIESMQSTLDLSKELCTSGWNGYPAINLPGSQIYYNAIKKGIELPETYTGYSFHSYDTLCNKTESLTAAQVLKFRDDAYTEYHNYPPFLERIKKLYGKEQADNIIKMAQIKLKRKLLGD
jgi:anaerobic magnesium-protoporphyrin IX monomethyl ester cyclase